MTLHDFATPTVPGNQWGRDMDTTQIRQWIRDGLLICHGNVSPHPLADLLVLSAKGLLVATGIDSSRWPFVCGQMARRNKLSKDAHSLEIGSDCHRHWVAGWEEG